MQIILDQRKKKLIYEFAKEMNYDTKSTGRPNIRHSSTIKRLESPAIMLPVSQKQHFYLLILMKFGIS